MLFPNLANQIGSSLIKRYCFEHDIGRITILQLLSRNKQVTRLYVHILTILKLGQDAMAIQYTKGKQKDQ